MRNNYETLNDAVWTDKGLGNGSTKVYYMKKETFAKFISGLELPTIKDLNKTHTLLGTVAETNCEILWQLLQGEYWSPEGEACTLLHSLGLWHTSMSVGDVIQVGDEYFVVAGCGFTKLEK